MQKLDGKTMDLVAENIQKMRELFPEIFTEGKVDIEKFLLVMGENIEKSQERYEFTWKGKTQATKIAQKQSTGTLRPYKEESKNWDITKNLYIEGDNLEVLRLLQKAYYKKVKMIYIDPPYNTGNDFVYNDDFRDNIKNYKEQTGQTMKSNPQTAGRYHSDWLNMIYPRLRLAHNLLKDDGIIFISIDDNELVSLRKVCDDLFGEENFVATLVWDKNRKNDAKYFSIGHEYMLVYFKNAQTMIEHDIVYRVSKEGVSEVKTEFERLRNLYNDDWSQVGEGIKKLYTSWEKDDARKPLARFTKIDQEGPYRDDGNISWPGGGGPKFDVVHPVTKKPCKIPDAGWRFSNPKRMQEEIDKGRVVFGQDETTLPRIRRNLFESDKEVMRSVNFSYAQTATLEFNKIFDNIRVFENPKHTGDIKQLIEYVSNNSEDIILDFFSGSGTTAHALMQLNAEDKGNRRFILVQLPEPCEENSEAFKAGYTNICEIGKERIRRAGDKIIIDTGKTDLDIGFKVFKLDSSNLKMWDSETKDIIHDLIELTNPIKNDRTQEDVLYEIMLKYGIDLTMSIVEIDVKGKKVTSVGMGYMLVCLEANLTLDVIEEIAKMKPKRAVFSDSGFQDDNVKTNAVQLLRKNGVEDFRAI